MNIMYQEEEENPWILIVCYLSDYREYGSLPEGTPKG
jgi:hypothetical protein